MIFHKRSAKGGTLCNRPEGTFSTCHKISDVTCPYCQAIIKQKRLAYNQDMYGKLVEPAKGKVRNCLKCGNEFEIASRFNFMCGCHTDSDLEFGWNERS